MAKLSQVEEPRRERLVAMCCQWLSARALILLLLVFLRPPGAAIAADDPYETLLRFATLTSKITNPAGCLVTASVDFDSYTEHLPVFRDAWLNRDYSLDFYRQRQKQVFVSTVLKRYAELLTEGLYQNESSPECSFAISVSYSDKLGRPQTLKAISWKFSRQKAEEIVWERFDPRNFAEVAIGYEISPEVANWISDEPSMVAGESMSSTQCDLLLFRANAIFIRATTYCTKNYMDSRAGFYALAAARQCAPVGEGKIMALGKEAMQELDRVAKQRGRNAACRWVDGVEREVLRAALNR